MGGKLDGQDSYRQKHNERCEKQSFGYCQYEQLYPEWRGNTNLNTTSNCNSYRQVHFILRCNCDGSDEFGGIPNNRQNDQSHERCTEASPSGGGIDSFNPTRWILELVAWFWIFFRNGLGNNQVITISGEEGTIERNIHEIGTDCYQSRRHDKKNDCSNTGQFLLLLMNNRASEKMERRSRVEGRQSMIRCFAASAGNRPCSSRTVSWSWSLRSSIQGFGLLNLREGNSRWRPVAGRLGRYAAGAEGVINGSSLTMVEVIMKVPNGLFALPTCLGHRINRMIVIYLFLCMWPWPALFPLMSRELSSSSLSFCYLVETRPGRIANAVITAVHIQRFAERDWLRCFMAIRCWQLWEGFNGFAVATISISTLAVAVLSVFTISITHDVFSARSAGTVRIFRAFWVRVCAFWSGEIHPLWTEVSSFFSSCRRNHIGFWRYLNVRELLVRARFPRRGFAELCPQTCMHEIAIGIANIDRRWEVVSVIFINWHTPNSPEENIQGLSHGLHATLHHLPSSRPWTRRGKRSKVTSEQPERQNVGNTHWQQETHHT